jgi:two-component system, NarL family, response regulator DegU
MEENKITIIITDDHKLFRKGLMALLQDFSFVDKIYEAGNGLELIELLGKFNSIPDIILLDIQMPVMDGMEAHRKIRETYPDIKVVILTMEDDEQFIYYMISEGVNGYLLKNAEPEELELALQKVMRNDFYFPIDIAQMAFKGAKVKNITLQKFPELTEKELQVLDLICREKTAAEIAEYINVSTRTVEGYKRKLLEKTRSKNMAGLVVFALKNNLVIP